MYLISPRVCSAAAAAKSLQSCLTLCDPIDCSPPGSPVPGVLRAGKLEWVAISFSSAWKWKVKSLSCVWLFMTPWTAAHQAPPSMGFSRHERWSGCHCLLRRSAQTVIIYFLVLWNIFNSINILFIREKNLFFSVSSKKKLTLTLHIQSWGQNVKRKIYFPSVQLKYPICFSLGLRLFATKTCE